MTVLVIGLSVWIVALLWANLLLVYKTAYYEQTLEDNKDKFTDLRNEQIQAVKNKKTPFRIHRFNK